MRKEKVGIISIHYGVNFGSALQAIALSQYLKQNFEFECVDVINYIPKRFKRISRLKNISGYGAKYFMHGLIRMSRFEKTNKKYISYLKENTSVSKPIYSMEKAKTEFGDYDYLIAGSDQIWNPDYNIPAFFLNFGRKDCRKIIYAASIGKGQLSCLEKKTYSKLLEFPDYISVREDSAQKLISSITEKNVELVLDPTLLHQQEYWMKKADDSSLNHRNYIFCYFLNLTDEKVKSANDFAKKNNCEVIAIPYLHNEVEKYTEKLEGKLLSEVNPADFLNLIRNAEAVITDSFHATVFSIIFQKDFWCFGRNAGTYNMNTRLHTLLGYVEMQDRLIEPDDLKNKMHCTHVDIDLHNLKIEQKESIAFLSNALEIS